MLNKHSVGIQRYHWEYEDEEAKSLSANQVSDEGLISTIYKELLQLSCKRPNHPENKTRRQNKKIWAKDLDISLKNTQNGQRYMERC